MSVTIEKFTVEGVEYSWYRYSEPLEILNASDVNRAKHNISTVKDILVQKGYTVGDLITSTAAMNTPLASIVDILNSVEYNLDVLDSTNIKSIYYDKSYRAEVGGLAHNKQQIWRWFQILDDVIEAVKGDVGKWQYLKCTDGYPTINGKKIMVRGVLIG